MIINEIARMRHDRLDRKERHIQNELIVPDLGDGCYELHLETNDQEETARRKGVS
jgi:hypothetical protein